MNRGILSLRGAERQSNLKIEHQLWNCEIASLRPEHHAVQGFARNDSHFGVIARSPANRGMTKQSLFRGTYGL
jgi:hypothetical protein